MSNRTLTVAQTTAITKRQRPPNDRDHTNDSDHQATATTQTTAITKRQRSPNDSDHQATATTQTTAITKRQRPHKRQRSPNDSDHTNDSDHQTTATTKRCGLTLLEQRNSIHKCGLAVENVHLQSARLAFLICT